MKKENFDIALQLCMNEQARIESMWEDDPRRDDYVVSVIAEDDQILVFPTHDDSFHCAAQFIMIANTCRMNWFIEVRTNESDIQTPCIHIF